jgi:hypothetical protein
MKAVLGFLLVSALFISAFAQPGPDTLWTRSWGAAGNGTVASLIPVSQGGFLAAGTVNGGVSLIRFDLNGDTLWTRRNAALTAEPQGLTELAAGGFMMTVHGYCTWIKYNANGIVSDTGCAYSPDWSWGNLSSTSAGEKWSQLRPTGLGKLVGHVGFTTLIYENHYNYGEDVRGVEPANFAFLWSGDYGVGCTDVVGLADGSSLHVGHIWTDTRPRLMHTHRPHPLPDINYVCTGHSNEYARVARNNQGAYFVASQCSSNYREVAVSKVSSAAALVWTQIFSIADSGTYVGGVCPTADGGAAILCYVITDSLVTPFQPLVAFNVVKLDATGTIRWVEHYGDIVYTNQLPQNVRICLDGMGGYILLATIGSASTGYSMLAMRTAPDLTLDAPAFVQPQPAQFVLHPAYPNPFNAVTEIAFDLPRASDVSLRVFDVLGRPVVTLHEGRMNVGAQRVAFDGGRLPSGVYFCRLSADNQTHTQKLLLLK